MEDDGPKRSPPPSASRQGAPGRIPRKLAPASANPLPALRPPLAAEPPVPTNRAALSVETLSLPPPPSPEMQTVDVFTIVPGSAHVRVLFDPSSSRHRYEVLEPVLSAAETATVGFAREALVRTMKGRPHGGGDASAYLHQEVDRVLAEADVQLDTESRRRILYYLDRDFLGYGPIDVMMRDPLIEDISCDGVGLPLYVFHRRYESVRSNVVFRQEDELDAFVTRLAQRSGKQITMARPLLDATLPDKSRLQASLSREVTTRGSSFTIRKFRTDPLTPPDLIRFGTMSASMAAFFWFALEEGISMVFAGGTASGKTSTLNAMCTFIRPQRKIVSIEDTREINLPHENWVAGLTRTGGEIAEGAQIDMYDLLVTALRQRPEYILVGEVRGQEAITLFQAMATGHATYSTLHADSAASAVYRLENPPINVPRAMIQTLGAISVQIQTRVGGRMVRRVREVVEIVGVDPATGDLLTNTVFEWDVGSDTHAYLGKSHTLDAVAARRNLSPEQVEQEWTDRTTVLAWLVRTNQRRLDQVVDAITAYYIDKKAVLARARDPEGPNER